MLRSERLFRVLSLMLLGVGFVASVAGADKDEAKVAVAALEQLIEDVRQVEEVSKINKGQFNPTFIVEEQSTISVAQKR